MKTVIVAINDNQSPTWNVLPPTFYDEFNNTTYIFHRSPHTEYNDDKLYTNYDYFIDCSHNPNLLEVELGSSKYIHIPRLSRTKQMLKIKKFNELYQVEKGSKSANYLQHQSISEYIYLNYPNHSLATFNETMAMMDYARIGNITSEYVVIKKEYGAKGLDQIVLPNHLLSTFLSVGKGLNYSELKERFPTAVFSHNVCKDTPIFESTLDIIVCELIPDVVKEWRILVSGDSLVVQPRVISNTKYPQAIIDHTTTDEKVYVPIRTIFNKQLSDTLTMFAKYVNLSFGSIDLYETANGEFGIFEFSNEFGHHATKLNYVRGLAIDAIRYMVQNKRDSLV